MYYASVVCLVLFCLRDPLDLILSHSARAIQMIPFEVSISTRFLRGAVPNKKRSRYVVVMVLGF